MNNQYSLDDEFGNRITTGVTYGEALQCGRKYLASHKDATHIEIYASETDTYVLDREAVLEGK